MITKIVRFTDLEAWKSGHQLVLKVYKATKIFPKDELFGLTIQVRRAVVSITSNIAEGFSRKSPKEKLQFCFISKGSLEEVRNQLIIARDLGYISSQEFLQFDALIEVTARQLYGMIKHLQNHS
jgi:four helix bundle protein